MPGAAEGRGAYQDLATVGCCPDARRQVDARPGVIEADAVDLGTMDADADLRHEALAAQSSQAPLNHHCCLDRLVGIGKGQEESVAGGLDLLAALLRDGCAHDPIVATDDPIPRLVAQRLGQPRGVDDVGEHQDPLHPAGRHSERGSIRSTGQLLYGGFSTAKVQGSTQALKRVAGGPRLDRGALRLIQGPIGIGQEKACPRHLEWSIDLRPDADRLLEQRGP